jgi:tryptophan 2,3-dioxygenase
MHVSAQFGLVSDLDEGIVLAMHKQSDVIVAFCKLCLKRVSLARGIRDGLLRMEFRSNRKITRVGS